MGIYDSDKEGEVLPQNSSSVQPNFDTNILLPHCQGRKVMNINMASTSKSLDNEESFCVESSLHSSTTQSSQEDLEDNFDSPQKSIIFNSNSFNEHSFEHRRLVSEEKVAELKDLLDRVNSVYVNWKINEFVLDTIKTKSTSWAQQIKAVTTSCKIQRSIQLKSSNGETVNLLGLEEEDINLFNSRSLGLFNKSAFFDHATEVLRANVARLKLQKKSLQDEFGAHSMKTMADVMTRERKEQAELYTCVEDLQTQARQLLSNNHTIVQQLATLRLNSEHYLKAATFQLIRNKALYLQTTVSTLKEKLDQSFIMDENMKDKMDSEGDNLRTRVSEMREELKALQKTLTEYERKEATSEKYRTIIEDCGKLKKQLDHKYQTLEMLNECNMSF